MANILAKRANRGQNLAAFDLLKTQSKNHDPLKSLEDKVYAKENIQQMLS
jgi:hypothetical protein